MAYEDKTTPAVGTGLPFDTIGGASFPRSKSALGPEGTAADAVGGAGPVGPGVQRTTLASDDVLVTAVGAANAAAATDETTTAPVIGILKGIFRDLRARLGAIGDTAWTGTGNGSVISILKAIATGILDTVTPAPITRGGTVLDIQRVALTASSAAIPTPPVGTKSMWIRAEAATVRFNPKGAATATSFPIDAGQCLEFPGNPTSLTNAQMIQGAAGAIAHVLYVG